MTNASSLTAMRIFVPAVIYVKELLQILLCGYFDGEFRHHREEQETGLFPALRARARGDVVQQLDELIAQLTNEHLSIEPAWKRLRVTLSDIAACRPAMLSADEVARFALTYRDHVVNEDERLIALGAQILGLS